MYSCYEFTFAGVASSMFGLAVCDIGNKTHSDNSFGNKANIIEKRLQNRVTPLHYGVNYHEEPLQFNLIFAAEESLDRYQLQEISRWLTGYNDYQLLSIDQDDMEHIEFKCLITSLTPISIGWFPYAFEAQITCDCPYAYSYEFNNSYSIKGTSQIIFHNDSTANVNLKPVITVKLSSGSSSISIVNKTTKEEFKLSSIPSSGIKVIIDNENCILRDDKDQYNLYSGFNFGFISFAPGDNQLEVTCNGTLEITGRFLYNVGA